MKSVSMKKFERYKISGRTKFIVISVICLLFLLFSAVCIKKQKTAGTYSFDLNNLEYKTAYQDNGVLRSLTASSDYAFATKPFILPAGGYIISVTYTSTVPSLILVQGNNDCVFNIELPPTGGTLQTVSDEHLILPNGTDRGKMKFYQEENGEICIGEIRIDSPVYIYNDYYAFIALAALAALSLILFVLFFNRLRLTRTELSYIGLLLITLIAVNIPFCIHGTYYEIDTQAHLKRIEAMAQGLRDGQFPVIIGPNYANQYGELIALQPGLFLYIPALLRLLNISVPTAYNIFMILINIFTAVAAILCAERLFTSIRWGIITAVFYLIEPFRLYVMLELGAGAGMGTALIFLPFLITGLHETLNRGGFRWKYIAVGLWGMACSHIMGLALSVLFMFLYILIKIKCLAEKGVLAGLVKAAAVFTVLSLGIMIPFLGYYFTDWNKTALQWTDFYHFPVEAIRELFNIIAFTILLISFMGARKTGYISRFTRGIYITGFISVLMSSPLFPWILFRNIGLVDTFLSMMQYPTRFHFITVPCVAYTSALTICSNMDSRTPARRRLMYSIVLLFAIGYFVNLFGFYRHSRLFGDFQTGEINTLMEDYLPAGTQTEWYETDTGDFSDYDAVTAYSYSKVNTHIDCTYTSSDEGEYMEFPLFYYDGYVAYDQNGIPLKVELGEKNRVRVYLTRSDEIQELHLKYQVKKLYTVSFLSSLIAGFLWFAYNAGFLFYRALKSKRLTV